jgi:hypothetical protein
MNKLLTDTQASRIYGAMCALNDIGGILDMRTEGDCDGKHVRVFENDDRTITVVSGGKFEGHDSQDAFAKFYSIVN